MNHNNSITQYLVQASNSNQISGDLSFGESFGAVAGAKHHPWVSILTESIFASSIAVVSRRIPLLKLALPFILPKELPQMLARHHELTREKTLKRVKMAEEVYRPDFFQQILSKGGDQVPFEELIEQASTLIIAGSETTATFLASVTFHLLKNRHCLDELTREIRSAFQTTEEINGDRCSELKYLNAVIEEGLRIWPPLSFGQLRESPGAVVSGVYLPPGTVCSVDMWSSLHNPKYWKDPDSFRPERWLGEGFGDNKAAFNPFLLGPRACLGINLAYLEMRIILALLVFTYDWEMANPDLDFWKDARATLFWVKPAVMVRFHSRKW
jgi:cytochrome P450